MNRTEVTEKKKSLFLISNKVLLGGIVFLFCVMCFGALFLGNGTFVDVLRGYVSMEQFQAGESFNTLNFTLAAEKLSYFIAWWTPGQAILPYAIHLIGIPLWISQGIWIVIFTGISLLGYYRLFQFFGFSRNASFISLLIIQTNQLFFWNTLLYFGGSLFEIGFLPWFILAVLSIRAPFTAKSALFYFIIAIGLFFFKATFLMHAGIGLAVLLFDYKKRNAKEISWIIVTGLAILTACYFGFLQFGETPSSAHDYGSYDSIPNNFWMDLVTPFASLFGVFTNIGSVLQKFFAIDGKINSIAFVVFPLLAFAGLWLLKRMYSLNEKTRKLVVYTVLFFCCFLYFYFTDRAISYDMRHFAPLAFVFVPFALFEVRGLIKSEWIFHTGINLLLLLNISLFVFQRSLFNLEMEQKNGMFFTSREASEMDNIVKAGEKTDCNTFLIVDNWAAQLPLKDKKVIPVFFENEKWYLKSGLEISQPREMDFETDLSDLDEFVLFLPGGKMELVDELKSFELTEIFLSRYYAIYHCEALK